MKKMKRIPFFLAAALICMGACSPEKESEKPAESVTETVGETKRQPETEISASEETEQEAVPEETELLSLMTDSRYDHIWEGDRRLSYVNYRKIWLDDREDGDSDTGAGKFPELAQALNEMNDQAEKNARQFLEELGDQARDLAKDGYFHELSYQSDGWVIRADSRVLSLLTMDYVYMGGAHGDYEYAGITFDSQSGRRLELEEVVTDTGRLAELAAERLTEKYPDVGFFEPPADVLRKQAEDGSLTWTAGYQGLTLCFSPYELAPYAYGMQSVTILYEEAPELFVPEICQVPGSWAVPLAPGMEFDLGQDGVLDRVEAGGVHGDGSAYEQFRVLVNGEESRKELWFYRDLSYLVHSDDLDTELLISETTSDNDFQITLVYELDPAKEGFWTPWEYSRLGFFTFYEEKGDNDYQYGTKILTDPDHFPMQLHMDLLSTYSGSRWYGLSEGAEDGGYLKPEQSWYDVDRGERYLTLLIPLEMEVGDQGDTRMFPAGTRLWIVRVQGNEVGFITEDGTDCRVSVDLSEWPGRVGGVDASEIFDGMMFAG